ncbi:MULTISPECIES: Hpt domain-containing protein [Arthrobacter]|uniref:Hpt domain-containing protein n=1 Tax=Arthrobacter TaxID=1663 RepID=UPI001F255F74|nr:Hpt domain-containing protein [Arthrobacter sp. H-02-3]
MDESKLQDLVDHVGRTAAATFASNFLALLRDRLTQVHTALGTADPEHALDAVLSLKTSSAMVGAEQLTRYCTGLEKELREGRIPNADALPRIAADLRPALTDVLASMPPDTDG